MDQETKKVNPLLFYGGIALIGLELFILYLEGMKTNRVDAFLFSNDTGFFVNYILAFIYQVAVFVAYRTVFNFRKIPMRYFIVSLTLATISCFSLNYGITIFAPLPDWLIGYLLVFYAGLLLFSFFEKLHGVLKSTISLILGLGIPLIIYFAIYLFPLYLIAVIGIPFLGISLHLLVPLAVVILSIILYRRFLHDAVVRRSFFFVGLAIPLVISIVFLSRWQSVQDNIHKASSSIITRPNNTLPGWVLLCQDMPTDWFSQKIIKGKLVYDVFDDMWDSWSRNSFDEAKKHDPLMNIGLAIFGDVNLSTAQRIKILKSQHNARHLAQRKLWSGRDLSTIEVLNNIKIFPEYRLAYSEKIITVKNSNRWARNQQEAAFTFYLPEGSVATSLSLWINGKEEKSRLTTKSKADSAYVSIVGVERRDPALMHWQEGNTLTVTVFPCTPSENRKFKIGITSPLEKAEKSLVYKSVYFEGPTPKGIRETSQVEFVSGLQIRNIDLPSGFDDNLSNRFLYTGSFMPYFEISCDEVPLSSKTFSFRDFTYRVEALQTKTKELDCKTIYLDINKSWEEDEYEELLIAFPNKKFFVYHDELIRVTRENQQKIFDLLSKKNFSLFPFNVIEQPENSLVVSKSTELSPNLDDLQKSSFLRLLTAGINRNKTRINLFQIGKMSSPYLKTLKEYQLFNFAFGESEQLIEILKSRKFNATDEDLNRVDIDIAQMSIRRDTLQAQSEAPDHLLRLFAYNRIVKELGRRKFDKTADYYDELVPIANEAYVVSPVSSLVVLETKADYDRFDIGENENSLKNASMKSSGAVPEPSEWALIILFSSLLFFLFLRKKRISFGLWKK